jgi:vancomycin resistance protein YoaR
MKLLLRREWLVGVAVIVAETSRARWARADAPTEHRTLGRFTTTFETDGGHRPRAFNVELAAQAIDGNAISPGATFSFNDTVGERTAAFGYERSVVLRRHMLAEGTGGGTCQVASTLHAAALLGGLDIVSRAPHSRPSAYIRMGLDATVAFPTIDLKLRNPRADRVVLRARASRGTLDVWLDADGLARPHVSIISEIVERIPFIRTVERARGVPADEIHLRTYGIPGYRVERTRDVSEGEVTHRDLRTDIYPPTPEVLVVSPTFDEARLDLREAEDTPEGHISPAVFRDEEGTHRPALVQLRPTTRVVIDNTT